MAQLFSNVGNLTWQQAVMWLIGGILIYLAVKRDMEPALLLPMGFGAILVNLPLSGAVTQIVDGVEEIGVLNVLFDAGIANELFPLLLFVGIGAMIDFEPLLNDPKLMFFGAAAQFGIFFTFSLAALLGFPIKDAAAIGIIGAADGPTAIFMANFLRSNYLGAIMVAAYSYMALGLVAFIFDTAGGVLVAKVINLFLPKEKKLNPMIGACGISAFPMSARVVYKMAIKEDPQNYLLMQCVGVNVSGQVASVIAGGLLLNLLV